MSELFTYSENPLSERSFRMLKEIIKYHSGINLNNTKIELVKNRLRKRLKARNLNSFLEYCELLQSDLGEEEIPFMIDAISTNITYFFRERAHYRFLNDHALPAISENLGSIKKLKIWSAACSSGEEPYSIAMIANAFFENASVDLKILATDINSEVLEVARRGIYGKQKLDEIPNYFREKYFKSHGEDFFKINSGLAGSVYFRKLNLVDRDFPFKGTFEIIFCRNTLIYFDSLVQKQVVEKFRHYLKKGGYLFLGHAESLNGKVDGFEFVAPAIYKKT